MRSALGALCAVVGLMVLLTGAVPGGVVTAHAQPVSHAASPYVLRTSQAARPEGPAGVTRKGDGRFARLIADAARDAALDPALVHALIEVESGYNPTARSPKGAIGLMQLMPATAARYGVPDPASSPEANLRAGTRYLSYLIGLFDQRLDLALAAYNAGEHAVVRYGLQIPPFRETQRYVPAVLARYHERRPQAPPAAPELRVLYLPGTTLTFNPLEGTTYRLQGARR